MIPKIIHKIWFNFGDSPEGEAPPQKYQEAEKKCMDINKDYKIMHWSEKDADDFIKKNYISFYDYFINYPKKIQKVDALRYFILYHYGGIYLDMDIECVKALNDYNFQNKVYIVEDNSSPTFLNPIKFNNFIMVSPPGHPFWEHVFTKLIEGYKKTWWQNDFWHILYSTGPGMLTRAYSSYPDKDKIEILKKEDFNPCDTCMNCSGAKKSYIKHTYGAMWTNGWDSLLKICFCYKWTCLTILFAIILIIVFSVLGAKGILKKEHGKL